MRLELQSPLAKMLNDSKDYQAGRVFPSSTVKDHIVSNEYCETRGAPSPPPDVSRMREQIQNREANLYFFEFVEPEM